MVLSLDFYLYLFIFIFVVCHSTPLKALCDQWFCSSARRTLKHIGYCATLIIIEGIGGGKYVYMDRLEICQKIYRTEDFRVKNLHRKRVIFDIC